MWFSHKQARATTQFTQISGSMLCLHPVKMCCYPSADADFHHVTFPILCFIHYN